MEQITNYITINTKNLKDIKNTFMSIIQSKVIYNIESNVLLQLKNNILTLAATDKNIFIEKRIKVINHNQDNFRICVYAKKFFDIIKEHDADFINISVQENQKIYMFYKGTYIIKKEDKYSRERKINTQHLIIGMNADEYPDSHINRNFKDYIILNKKELFNIFKKSINTVSKDNFRSPALKGLYFDFLDNNTLNIVSTDGRQIAIYKMNYEGRKLNNAVIPSEAIKALLKNISNIDKDIDNEDTVKIFINDEYIQIIDNDYIYTSSLIEASYPNYKSIIPCTANEKYKDEYKKLYNVILNNQQMIEIQKAVKSLKKSNKIKSKCLKMKFNKNQLILTIADYADSDIHNISNVIIDNINSNIEHTLNINYDHLLNILSQTINKDNNNKITLEIYKEPSKPLKILHNNAVFLIMLMGIDEEYNKQIEEYIKNFIESKEHTKENTAKETILTRQQRRFIIRQNKKEHNVTFIKYSRKIIDYNNYNAIELIKYINSLKMTDDEKIALFNMKYNNCKKPYTWHITDTKKIDILKTA
ncbi:DNA polymerase III subunit beta [Brachyspira alvinipulli]|uniref:DNA polymerase III subunit beta n=1 Tax=Brachyspira alvinipulli TaxID=84379 RepID=UPI00048043FD|nr:DNA polymerase III subunit beta [Brachyspira alvinipulli]